jgi:hypothetical protein
MSPFYTRRKVYDYVGYIESKIGQENKIKSLTFKSLRIYENQETDVNNCAGIDHIHGHTAPTILPSRISG